MISFALGIILLLVLIALIPDLRKTASQWLADLGPLGSVLIGILSGIAALINAAVNDKS